VISRSKTRQATKPGAKEPPNAAAVEAAPPKKGNGAREGAEGRCEDDAVVVVVEPPLA
jgi:hypothetical protein